MRKMWQCATALGLAAAMVMPAAAYAGETETETAESADDDAAYAPMDETVTIHVGRSEDANAQYLDGQDSLHNYLTDYIREKANVDFVYDFSVSSDYETKVSMAIASGDIPDVMFVTASQIRELAEADAVEDMTDVYNTYASSNLKAAYDTTDGISFQNATYDGKDGVKMIKGVKSKKWSLVANHLDASLLRNKVAMDLACKLGIGMESRFMDV